MFAITKVSKIFQECDCVYSLYLHLSTFQIVLLLADVSALMAWQVLNFKK